MLLALLECSQKFPSAYITQQCTRTSSLFLVKEIARAKTCDVSSVHYNSIKHARDVSSVLYGAIMNSN